MEGIQGLKKGGYVIAVMHMPGRKKPCLAIQYPDENAYYKVASFNNEEAAQTFIDHLAEMWGEK